MKWYINDNLKFKVFNKLSKINKNLIIFLFYVLEHIPTQIVILKRIKKKKKNGVVIIEVPHAKDFLIETLNLKCFKILHFGANI